MTPDQLRPTVARIDLDAIRHNVATLIDIAAPAEVCAVVKADAYGHGAIPVARAALDAGATWLAVAIVEEGRELRAAGIDAPILVLAEPPPAAAADAIAAGLDVAVYSTGFGEALQAAARAAHTRARAHLKVDTGMARVGAPIDAVEALTGAMTRWDHLDLAGLWTHLAVADEPGNATTDAQLDRFDLVRAQIAAAGLVPDVVHAANSAATLVHPRSRFDLVRVGIAAYGLAPSTEVTARAHGLRPALQLTTHVAFAKRVAAGTPVSYGHTFASPAAGWLATVPIGYADGMPRVLSNRVEVLIGGRRCRVAGTICMDQSLIWCGDLEPHPGDEVVLLGGQGGAEVTVEEWADHAGTISYEIVCGLGPRVPRTYTEAD